MGTPKSASRRFDADSESVAVDEGVAAMTTTVVATPFVVGCFSSG
jgi:hypothetical protein